MKIIFWSPMHGQAGTTSNILAAALLTGINFRKKAVLTQTQFQFNNLEAPIVGANPYHEESKDYFREVGLDTLIRCFKAAKLDLETIANCCIAIENSNILLLPGTTKTIRESFEYEMEMVISNLLQEMEALCGIVFLDICSGGNSLSKKLLEEADLIVVNLNQNVGTIDLFFNQYENIMQKKVFYLFGRYDCNSKYNLNNLRRKYHKYLHVKNTGVIPYDSGFMDAQADGKVVEFIRSNLNDTKKDHHNYFMKKAKKATEKILKLAGANV